MIPELRPRHIHGYGRQGIGWQQAEHYRVRALVAEAALEEMRAKVAELEAKLASLTTAAALQDVIASLPRYEVHVEQGVEVARSDDIAVVALRRAEVSVAPRMIWHAPREQGGWHHLDTEEGRASCGYCTPPTQVEEQNR